MLASSLGELGSVPAPVKEEWGQLGHPSVPSGPSCSLTALGPFRDDGKRTKSFHSGLWLLERKPWFSQRCSPETVKSQRDTIDEAWRALGWVCNADEDDPL